MKNVKRPPKGWKHTKETREKMTKNNHMLGRFSSQTYHAIHLWLRKFDKVKCDHCGGDRFLEFALMHGYNHEHNRENYLVLCSSCHKKYDYTDERKKKVSESLKGRQILWVDKIAKANTGKKHTEVSRIKMSRSAKNRKVKRQRNSMGQYV